MLASLIAALMLQAAAPDDPVEEACYARDVSQQAMNRCAGEAYQRADATLNAQWRAVMARYNGDRKARKLLLDGQRAWLKYRDAQCQIAALDNVGGSIWLLINSGCLASMTRARTHELKLLLDGKE